MILSLLNDPAVVSETNSLPANAGGLALFAVTAVLAGEFVLAELETVTEPLSAFVVVFAAAMALAILGVAGRDVRKRIDAR